MAKNRKRPVGIRFINYPVCGTKSTASSSRRSQKKFEGSDIHRSERFVGKFQRTLTLPSQVDVDKVKANYQDGILTVTLPKSEAAKPKQIQIKTR